MRTWVVRPSKPCHIEPSCLAVGLPVPRPFAPSHGQADGLRQLYVLLGHATRRKAVYSARLGGRTRFAKSKPVTNDTPTMII